MKVVIDGSSASVAVDDAEDLNVLSVVLRDATPEDAGRLIGDLGCLKGGYAWLNIETLKAISPKSRSCSWDARFARAMAYAEKSGWIDPTGSFVRAHIEPTEHSA
jgi:hypothetical protein